MPRTATKSRRNGVEFEKNQDIDKSPRVVNPLMKKLTPDMLLNPHALDFAEGMNSRDFALEKCVAIILDPLEFQSQKEWLDFSKEVWKRKAEKMQKRIQEEERKLGKLKETFEALV